jgi:hypothetical protein
MPFTTAGLRTLGDIYEKIEYVHNNPVRRGLAGCAQDWTWSSCLSWETGVDTPIPIDRQSLPALSQIPETQKYPGMSTASVAPAPSIFD